MGFPTAMASEFSTRRVAYHKFQFPHAGARPEKERRIALSLLEESVEQKDRASKPKAAADKFSSIRLTYRSLGSLESHLMMQSSDNQ